MPQPPQREIPDASNNSHAPVDRSEWAKEYYQKNKNRIEAYRKTYHIEHREEILKRVREHYHNNRDKRLAYGKRWREANKDKMAAYKKTSNDKLRKNIYDAYGGAFCACCGENQQEFLSIDHINGNGNEHRRLTKTRGVRISTDG